MSTFDAGKAPARNSYDADVPPNLLQFMLKSWSAKPRKLPKILPNAASFRERRERLSQRFPGELLVIPTGHLIVRANDTHFSISQAIWSRIACWLCCRRDGTIVRCCS